MISLTLSFAQSLDACIATKTNDSQWISCPESLVFAHELRKMHDAIMVGRGTVEIDNPMLNSRLAGDVLTQPTRIILDSNLSLDTDYKVFQTARLQKTIIFTLSTSKAKKEKIQTLDELGVGIEFMDAEHMHLPHVLQRLSLLGFKSLFVEGGSRLITSIIRDGLWDKIYLVIAPLFIGGKPAISDLGHTILKHIPRYTIHSTKLLGKDICLEINKLSTQAELF